MVAWLRPRRNYLRVVTPGPQKPALSPPGDVAGGGERGEGLRYLISLFRRNVLGYGYLYEGYSGSALLAPVITWGDMFLSVFAKVHM